MTIGVSALTGQLLGGEDHLKQSIADILMTPIGSRVMRRDYGSLLPELIDQPFNQRTIARLYGAVAMALMKWEPRLRLQKVALSIVEAGGFLLEVQAERRDRPKPSAYVRLTLPIRTNNTVPTAPGLAPEAA